MPRLYVCEIHIVNLNTFDALSKPSSCGSSKLSLCKINAFCSAAPHCFSSVQHLLHFVFQQRLGVQI